MLKKRILFRPGNITVSDPYRFVPEDDKIRLPFNCPEKIDGDGVDAILKESDISDE